MKIVSLPTRANSKPECRILTNADSDSTGALVRCDSLDASGGSGTGDTARGFDRDAARETGKVNSCVKSRTG